MYTCVRACVRACAFGFERNGVCASGQNVSFRSSAGATRDEIFWHFYPFFARSAHLARACVVVFLRSRAKETSWRVWEREGARRTFAGVLGVGQMASSVRREPRTASARVERRVQGSSGSAGARVTAAARFLGTRDSSSVEIWPRCGEGAGRARRETHPATLRARRWTIRGRAGR